MDSAFYHRFKETMNALDKLGVSVLFDQPVTPDLNMAEFFICDLKQKLKTQRD